MDLLLVLPLILAIATTFTAAQFNWGNYTLLGCPISCGTIEIPYPFGYLPGCYRPGFQLTCNTSGLFIVGNLTAIEVTSIPEDSNQLYVSVPYIVSAQDGISRDASWATALVGTPYTISSKYNNLYATGCGVVASLLYPDTEDNVATCASFCRIGGYDDSRCEIGFGCCWASIPPGLRTYSIKLDSTETDMWGGFAAVMANNYFDDANADYVGPETLKSSTRVEVMLDWVISDAPSCEVAIQDLSSYACLNYSRCIDMPEGYICDCESHLGGDDGNPYVPNSCPEVVTLMSAPANCQRKCGGIDIPFPFGLERGCYRHENFSIECTWTNNRQFPTYGDTEVIQIMIGEGKMRLKSARQTAILDGLHTNNINSAYDIDGVVGLGNCTEAKTQSDYPCISSDSYCFVNPLTEDFTDPGYNCGCEKGYHGNPYTHGGCQDIDECIDPERYGCYRKCTNLLGSFICECGLGIHSNCADQKTKQVVLRTIFICVSIGFGLILLFFCGVILYKKMKQRIREKIKQKNFQENRDLLRQQKHSSNVIAKLRIKIFSLEDLEKATNNFDSKRIVGSGSYGTVYKGMLSDQRVVAIKKSMREEATETLQFINEIFILSIINHRNVVKLFGCCLETEVALLVFEFIAKGSLSDHLHGSLSDQLHVEKYKSSLSWDDRLRIAAETAGALANLQSAASISIFHGDVKTANILLDDNFSAKVSDLGTSRSRPVGKTRVRTQIKGTDFYLDPEYQHTSQLTEKSDVYSFGVILVELLTGEMPISFTKCRENMNLCMSFLQSLKENRLVEILEPIVTEGALTEELDAVAKLAEACLNIRGKDRPTMKEVFARLESLIKAEKWKPELIRRESQEEIEYHGEQSDQKIIRRESQEEIEYYGEQSEQKTKQVILRGVILYNKMKQRIRKKISQKYIQENSDLLRQLQQMQFSNDIAKLRIRIFSLKELEKATNNFDSKRCVGCGSNGRVYKGILSDQRVVAIKKSKRVEATEILRFINEISILSIVNHKNVVKLFGCCLETEVPLLVFEFITNGSLFDHLHVEKYTSSLSWDDRLRIATETAGALAYLHSAASFSIFHGDVKTSNILLDDNFSAKVSDFGTSRSRPVDKTRVVTQINGTDGYLDPEYHHTGQLTEKSDVYSFGVILVELLTGEMPISFTKCRENMNLCMSFLQLLEENRLVEILEPIVTEGALTEQLDAVAKLAEACLNIRGVDRPTMKEVFARLESLIKAEKWKPELIRRESQEEEIEYDGEQFVLEL